MCTCNNNAIVVTNAKGLTGDQGWLGKPGVPGADGATGPKGPDGAAGLSIDVTFAGEKLHYYRTDDTPSTDSDAVYFIYPGTNAEPSLSSKTIKVVAKGRGLFDRTPQTIIKLFDATSGTSLEFAKERITLQKDWSIYDISVTGTLPTAPTVVKVTVRALTREIPEPNRTNADVHITSLTIA